MSNVDLTKDVARGLEIQRIRMEASRAVAARR